MRHPGPDNGVDAEDGMSRKQEKAGNPENARRTAGDMQDPPLSGIKFLRPLSRFRRVDLPSALIPAARDRSVAKTGMA